MLDVVIMSIENKLSMEIKRSMVRLLIFPWLENKLITVNLKANSTVYVFLMLMKNLRWVIIQDCSIVLNKYKRKHSIFHMFRNIFQSKLFFYYQSKMLIHIKSHEDQDSLLTSVERVLSGVK